MKNNKRFLKKKTKNFILKGITLASLIAWVVSGRYLNTMCFLFLISSLWIILFSVANGFSIRLRRKKK